VFVINKLKKYSTFILVTPPLPKKKKKPYKAHTHTTKTLFTLLTIKKNRGRGREFTMGVSLMLR
jgi:hypothetical protein